MMTQQELEWMEASIQLLMVTANHQERLGRPEKLVLERMKELIARELCAIPPGGESSVLVVGVGGTPTRQKMKKVTKR
jgi:hypothetical protein